MSGLIILQFAGFNYSPSYKQYAVLLSSSVCSRVWPASVCGLALDNWWSSTDTCEASVHWRLLVPWHVHHVLFAITAIGTLFHLCHLFVCICRQACGPVLCAQNRPFLLQCGKHPDSNVSFGLLMMCVREVYTYKGLDRDGYDRRTPV